MPVSKLLLQENRVDMQVLGGQGGGASPCHKIMIACWVIDRFSEKKRERLAGCAKLGGSDTAVAVEMAEAGLHKLDIYRPGSFLSYVGAQRGKIPMFLMWIIR